MRIWFALIVAPLLALADQLLALTLVGWACSHQSTVLLHGSHVVFLALTTLAAAVAWQAWHESAVAPASDGEPALRVRFLAGVATIVAALSAAAIAAMWMPTWMISSCIA